MLNGPTNKLEPRSYWRFQIYVWGFQASYMLMFAVTTPPFFQWPVITIQLVKIVVLAVISHFIACIAFSRHWLTLHRPNLIRNGMAAFLIGGLVPTVIFYPINQAVYSEWYSSPLGLVLSEYTCNITVLTMWGGFFLAFYFYALNRRSEMDRMKMAVASKEAQLVTLKSQLNPHFLFNSLNVVRSLVQSEPAIARNAITQLAEMMRHSLTLAHHNTIALSHELSFVESYLMLERLRYEERLRIHSEVPEELKKQLIPSMLLYTLVENAVKYGVDQSRSGVDVDYSVWREGDDLFLRVTNGGKMVAPGNSTGTGLINVSNRLHLLYGEESCVRVFQANGKVVAEAKWPIS